MKHRTDVFSTITVAFDFPHPFSILPLSYLHSLSLSLSLSHSSDLSPSSPSLSLSPSVSPLILLIAILSLSLFHTISLYIVCVQQMALLEDSMTSMRMQFNERFLSLRDLKRQIIYSIRRDNARIREIDIEVCSRLRERMHCDKSNHL